MFNTTFPTILYMLGYVAIFIFLLRKKYDVTILFIVSIWIVSSIYALVFQSLMPQYVYNNITYLPYAFLLLCFGLTLIPVCKGLHLVRDEYCIANIGLYKKIMLFFIVVSLVPLIENLRYFLTSYGAANTSGLADMYDDKMSMGLQVTWLSFVGKLGNSLDGIFIQFLMFIPFVFLTQKKISKWMLICSFLPALNHVIFQMCASGRTVVTQFTLIAVFFLFFFRKAIPAPRWRLIRICLIVFFVLFGAALSVLTSARKEAHNRDNETYEVYGYYLAKSHLDFNHNLWYIKKNTEGDNSFGFVKSLLGFDVPENKNDYWTYNKIGVIPSLFYTYIGDWYMDFGPIITLVLFIFVSIFCTAYFSRKCHNVPIIRLFAYYVLCQIIFMGWSFNCFKTPMGFRNLLISMMLIIIVQNFSKHARLMYDK